MRRDYFVALFLVSVAASAAAEEIRVPQDEPTINDAIGAAAAFDVIVVSQGVYDEHVVVFAKSDLTIEARGKVLIRTTGTGFSIEESTNITVTGIAVRDTTIGFNVFDSTGITIQKFAVTNVTDHGVLVNASSDVHLLKGRISDCGNDGIHFGDAAPVLTGEISGVKVKKCEDDGIDVFGTDVVVSRCKVSDVLEDCFETQEGASPVRLEDCKASDAGNDGFNAGAEGTEVIRCSAKKCDDDGFDVEGSNTRLEDCLAKSCDDRGFALDDVDDVTVLRCRAIGSADQGFELQNATNSRIELCLAIKSGDQGFRLTGTAADNTLIGNKASKSGTFDLDDESVGPTTLTDNKFKTVDPN